MKFTYKSEEDAKKEMLLPEGVYDFEVMDAEDKQSKKGNDMIVVKLRVFSDNGERHVTDYIMEVMRFKLLHFCRVTGLWDKYEAGSLIAHDCIGRAGKVRLVVEEQEGFSPKNSVKDYIVPKEGEAREVVKGPAVPAPSHSDVDASIPF